MAGGGVTEEEAARLEAEAKQAEERLRQCRAAKRQDSDALRALTKERQKLEVGREGEATPRPTAMTTTRRGISPARLTDCWC